MNRLLALALTLLAVFSPARARAQGVTLDAAGWTQITLSPDSKTFYVDSIAGNDANPGTQAAPEKTIKAGFDDLRNGFPDHLVIRGTFSEVFPNWTKSGRSAQEPMVVDGGTAQAKIRGGAGSTALHYNGGGGAPSSVQHVIFKGLDMEPVGRNGSEAPRGIEILLRFDDVLFEGCRIAGFATNVVIQDYGAASNNVRFRRCVISGAWSTGSEHSQGLYVQGATNLDVFECAFVHNGFSSQTGRAGADIFRHCVYVQNGPAATFWGCVFADASSHGLQLRGGGSVIACLFVRNPIALLVGGGNTPSASGVIANVRGCVILEGADINPQNPRGWAVNFAGLQSGLLVDTYIAHQGGGQPSGISLDGGPGAGINNLTIARCTIHQDWGAGLGQSNQSRIQNLALANNHFLAPAATLVAPSRGVPTYMASLGQPASTDAYLDAIKQQGPGNWNPKLWPQGGVIRHAMAGLKQK